MDFAWRRRIPESAAADLAFEAELAAAARHVADVLGLSETAVAERLRQTLRESMVTADEAAAAILDGEIWESTLR